MSKVITSTVNRWPGTVTLRDPLTLDQAIVFEEAEEAAGKYRAGLGKSPYELSASEFSRLMKAWEPGLLACIESADIPALPEFPAHLPGSPVGESKKFVVWLLAEITKVYRGEAEVPNA